MCAAVRLLPPVEQRIVASHYGIGTEPLTLREIGSQLGLAPPRVGQIEARALARLGDALGDG